MSDSYKRILVKLSGEMLMGEGEYGIDTGVISRLADDIKELHDTGVEVGIVLGAGNIWRGVSGAAQGLERSNADYMGMLATVINAMAFQNVLESKGLQARVMSAISMESVAEPYIRRRAIRHMEKGRITIFAAGTGNPFFTTDTAAALRAVEVNADLLVKATKVDGIYTADPYKNPDAEHFEEITYQDVLVKNLRVMDAAAVALCQENKMPLLVCSVKEKGTLLKAIQGDAKRTLVAA